MDNGYSQSCGIAYVLPLMKYNIHKYTESSSVNKNTIWLVGGPFIYLVSVMAASLPPVFFPTPHCFTCATPPDQLRLRHLPNCACRPASSAFPLLTTCATPTNQHHLNPRLWMTHCQIVCVHLICRTLQRADYLIACTWPDGVAISRWTCLPSAPVTRLPDPLSAWE